MQILFFSFLWFSFFEVPDLFSYIISFHLHAGLSIRIPSNARTTIVLGEISDNIRVGLRNTVGLVSIFGRVVADINRLSIVAT